MREAVQGHEHRLDAEHNGANIKTDGLVELLRRPQTRVVVERSQVESGWRQHRRTDQLHSPTVN